MLWTTLFAPLLLRVHQKKQETMGKLKVFWSIVTFFIAGKTEVYNKCFSILKASCAEKFHNGWSGTSSLGVGAGLKMNSSVKRCVSMKLVFEKKMPQMYILF